MNRGITKENLLLIMPPALIQDKSIMALAEVYAEALAARPAEIDKVRVIANIDELDEAVLDILARDFKVDWWDQNYSIEEKRRTLKGACKVHRIKGTKAAVETAISAIYPGTKVQEWWEYGGEPFCFRLSLNARELRPDTEKHKKVLERVNYYKSLRSHLDGFIWNFTGEPFPETPGHLIFRRFVMAGAFPRLWDSSGPSFPRFRAGTYRFPHFSGTVRFDGGSSFDGSITFDQTYGSLGFPSFRMNSKFHKPKERLHTPSFRGAGTARVTNQGGDLSLLRFTYTASMKHSENLSGKITMENWYAFNGEFNFDGSSIFNAYIKEEEL